MCSHHNTVYTEQYCSNFIHPSFFHPTSHSLKQSKVEDIAFMLVIMAANGGWETGYKNTEFASQETLNCVYTVVAAIYQSHTTDKYRENIPLCIPILLIPFRDEIKGVYHTHQLYHTS